MATARFLLLTFAALLLSASLGEAPTRAATSATSDLTELLGLADVVVEIQVLQISSQFDKDIGLPYSVATLKVEKSYKGGAASGVQIRCEYFGDPLSSGQKTIVPGQPVLKTGDRAVLLLAANKKRPENWRVLGGELGLIALETSKQGAATARRASGHFEFFVADDSSLTGYSPVNSAVIQAAQLKDVLQATLSAGRPVLEKNSVAAPEQPRVEPSSAQAVNVAPAATITIYWPRAAFALIALSILWVLFRRTR
jgi:hypothetical protein